MHAFRLTENKPIYLVLANVGSKKNFFFYEVTTRLKTKHATKLELKLTELALTKSEHNFC